MKVLVTGGAGFIGRWVTKRLLDDGAEVWVLDNLSNGFEENLAEFKARPLQPVHLLGDFDGHDEDLLGGQALDQVEEQQTLLATDVASGIHFGVTFLGHALVST